MAFTLEDIPTNIDAFLTANGVNKQAITEIRPKTARLYVNFADVDFAFVQEVVVEIYTNENTIGKEIFFRDPVPLDTGLDIDLIPSLPEVTGDTDG